MENKSKISVQELTEEIIVMLKDEFVATCKWQESQIELHFLNGQRFHVSVEEI